MQAVDQFFVGVLLGLEVAEVLVVLEGDFFDLLVVVLVDPLDLGEEVHDDLDVLDLLPGLDFPVEGEAVLEGEDGFGVFGHHDQFDFVLDELEVELGVLQVLVVLLVPGQLQQSPDQLELEQEVDARLVAPVYQLHYRRLDPVLQRHARPLQEAQVHLERELQGGDVRFLLGGALPVDESVAEVQQVDHLLLAGLLPLDREGVQEGDEELGLEEVVLLVDAVDEPGVLEDVEEEVAVAALLVAPASDGDDALAALVVEDEAGVLLLDVACEFEAVDGEGVLDLVGHLEAAPVHGLQQEDVVLQVLLFVGELHQRAEPPLDQRVARVVLLLLRHQHRQAREALQRHVALRDVLQDLEDLLAEDVQDLIVHPRQVAQQAAEPVELPRPHSPLELPAPQNYIHQLCVVLQPLAVAVRQLARIHQRGLLLVHERRVRNERRNQLRNQLVLNSVGSHGLRSEYPKDVP